MTLRKTNSILHSKKQNFLTKLSVLSRTRFKRVSLNKSRWNKGYVLGFINCHLVDYPTPICLSYAWSFGSLAGICLVIQILSGVFLSIHYVADMNHAFQSIQYIMRDVPNGWLIRYAHANGASMFFIVVYCHIFRGLYYGSYMKPRQALWCSGVVLFLLLMGTAFTGYVLPWGQMSFWGATVITNMVTALPGGKAIVEWVWGGYTVNSPPTLRRFYSVHFALPFIISGVTIIHLALLHRVGSTSPIGSDTGVDDVPFYPYYFAKDLFALNCFLFFFAGVVLLFPDALNHPDNYIPADPMETPKQLVPEWYFLPFYAILRSIPHKGGGISAMGGAIIVLFLIPFNYTGYVRNTTYRPLFKVFYWFLVADFLALFYIGQAPIEDQYIFLGQIAAVYYFSFFIVAVPLVGLIENKLVFHKMTQTDQSSARRTDSKVSQKIVQRSSADSASYAAFTDPSFGSGFWELLRAEGSAFDKALGIFIELNTPLLEEEYFQIRLFIAFAVFLAFIIVSASYLLVTQKPESEKLSTYECGFEPYEDAKNKFDVQFYVVALLFVLFDIEIIVLLPWCLSLASVSLLGYWSMLEFLLELGLGFVYVWCVGALDW